MMGTSDKEASIERLTRAFAEIMAASDKGGAALSIWRGDQSLLSLQGGEAIPGRAWTSSTPCLIWSASKGIAAACTAHALQKYEISLESCVADLWPEFSTGGKGSITLAQLLSHRAGLAALETSGLSITDHDAVASALADQPPNWKINGCHGYGARTFGFLLDEIVRRLTGETLADYWNRVFREPLSLDLWFGVPPEVVNEAACVIAPKSPPLASPFTEAFGDPYSLTRRALSEPNCKRGALTPSVMNTPEMQLASIPSLGVIATAEALARFYSFLSKPNDFFNTETRSQMQTTLSRGLDLTLLDSTSFSAGFMTNDFGVYGPGKLSFGHPGAGGSIAFADPELGLGFAFIPSAMHPGALPGPRTQKLVRALYGLSTTA